MFQHAILNAKQIALIGVVLVFKDIIVILKNETILTDFNYATLTSPYIF